MMHTRRAVTGAAGLFLALSGPAIASPATVSFTATVQTVGGTPFGFSTAITGAQATGSFTYNTATADTNPGDTTRGNYPHTGGGGAFTATVGGKTITGSSTPLAQVENLNPDTFRFEDGPANGG